MNLASRLAKLEGYRKKAGTGPCRECGSKPPKATERSKPDWLGPATLCPRCARPDERLEPAKEYARVMTAYLKAKA